MMSAALVFSSSDGKEQIRGFNSTISRMNLKSLSKKGHQEKQKLSSGKLWKRDRNKDAERKIENHQFLDADETVENKMLQSRLVSFKFVLVSN